MRERFCDIAVVGAGPAGLAAAAAALKGGAENVILVEQKGEMPAEKPGNTGRKRRGRETGGIRRFPEEKEGGAAFTCCRKTIATQIRGMTLLCMNPEGFLQIHFSALILAMGRKAAGEGRGAPRCPNNGFYTAEQIDGCPPNTGKPGRGVVILGSSDDSLLLARRMAQSGVRVRGIVEPLPEMAGSVSHKEQCLDVFRIPLFLSHTVIDVWGADRSVTLAPVDSDHRIQTERAFVVPCDTLVYSQKKDLRPAELFLSEMPFGIKVNRLNQTQVPWVFACGDMLRRNAAESQVAREGAAAGRYATLYARGGLPDVWDGTEAGENLIKTTRMIGVETI